MRILIIEDEPNATERLENLIEEIAPGKQIIGRLSSVQQTLLWFKNNETPDLILSDVELSDGLSFDIFSNLKQKVPVIFISAFNTYAVDAFKAEGIHYLLKPIKKEELKDAISRYDHSRYQRQFSWKNYENLEVVKKHNQERFIVHIGKQMKLIQDTEIAYLYTESKTVFLVTFDKQKFIVDIPLERFEKILNPDFFYRINRQFIVHLKAITKMTSASKQRIALFLDPATSYETITSFERTPQFKKWLLGNT